jgi:hypothetical protein
MKYLNKIVIVIALLVVLLNGSCSDVLDQAPDGKISLDEVFADNDRTAAYLNSCYLYIPTGGVKTFFWCRAPSVWTDDAWDTDAEAEAWINSGKLYNGEASASNHPIINNPTFQENNSDFWNIFWQGIRKCTVFLSRIDAANVTSEADRSRWIAEAHLLRAYYYHELLRWFGCGLPIEETPYSLDFDFSTTVKASYKETVDFIISDCDRALANNDLPWRISSGAEAFRFTKAVAEVIKSRMSLFAASPLYNDGQNYWSEAYTINKASLQNLRNQNYVLYDKVNLPATYKDANAYFYPDGKFPNDYAALYNEYFCTNMEYSSNPIDKETIYQTNAGQDKAYHIDGIGAIYQYKAGTCPSQEIVDCYEMTNGEPVVNLSKPYNDEITHLQPNINTASGYNEQNPYVNRDPRFYASIYYNGSKRYCYWPFQEAPGSIENYPAGPSIRTRVVATWDGEPQTGISPTARARTRTGYYIRKFCHPTAGDQGASADMARYKSMRFAEVLMNFAEAALEADHLDEARSAVNEIRARVGMPALPSSLSKDELRVRIRNERRIEFAFEGHRYYDVRRWHSPGEDLEKTDRWITAAWITRNANGTYTYTRGPVSRERLCYTNKFLYLPIPMDEVNKMISLTGENWQNPGW